MYSTSADGEVESVVLLSVDELVGRGVASGVDGCVDELVGGGVVSGVDGLIEAVEVSGFGVLVEESSVEDMIVDEVCIFGSLVVELGRTVEGTTLVSAFVFVDLSSFKVNVEVGEYDVRGV